MSDEGSYCNICFDNTRIVSQEGGKVIDDLVYCELCNSLTHQRCYGSELYEKIPEGDFFCQRCTLLMEKDYAYNGVRCQLCPDLRGVMKRAKNFRGEKFVHVTCVLWNQKLEFKD